MTRILFVLNAAKGGATQSALSLMEGLRARGHECFAALPPGEPLHALEAIRRVAADMIEVPMPWWNKKYRVRWFKRPVHWALGSLQSGCHLRSAARLARAIKSWRVDLVHSNTSLTLEGALAARLAGRPHVWHIREQIGRRQLFRFWLPEPLLARLFCGLSATVIANSRETWRFFARNGRGDEVKIVYNGLELDAFDNPTPGARLRQSWGVSERTPLVGMVANLTSRCKNHEVFLRMAEAVGRAHPLARFVIVGDDPQIAGGYRGEVEYARSLKELAGRLQLNDRLIWAGYVADPPAVMNAIDLLVHPGDQESFGRVAVEALAAGRPVVAAGAGGLVEIVDDGQTGCLIPEQDPEKYAAATGRLIERPEMRKELGEEGRRRMQQRFSLRHALDQVEEVYSAAGARKSPAQGACHDRHVSAAATETRAGTCPPPERAE